MIHWLTPTDELRFWEQVEEVDGHWLWTGHSTHGYGKFGFGGEQRYAHRVSYYLEHGTLPPDGWDIDHLCRVTLCVRPTHLEPVIHADNIRRHFNHQTHCKYGHEFTEENTYRSPKKGRRECRACRRERKG